MSKEIIRRETRFAVHLPKTDYRPDTHYVKEQVFYDDGTSQPRTFLIKDFMRPVWVTKPAARNHSQKKEFESRDNLREQRCTQSEINKVVAGLLDEPYLANKPDELKSSPYVYGYDQTSTSLIKLQSLRKNNFLQSPYTISAFDIETSIETREILLATIVFGLKARVTVNSKLVKMFSGQKEVMIRLNLAIDKYLPTYAGKLQIELTVHDHEADMLKEVFKTANEWGPDFLAIWNINFDIPRCLERLKAADVNPIDVICDQKVPRQFRVCRYKEGITKKMTASGTHKPINPSLQWHYLTSTSTFYAVDAMCVYRQIRMAKQEEPSYSLDAILNKVLKRGKLKFEEANEHTGANWHIFMQANYPIEYIVYNLYDCLGMLELDAETKDLAQSFPSGAGMTDFAKYNSNPKKIVDALFLFGLERNLVIGTVGKVKKSEEESVVEAIDTDDAVDWDEEPDILEEKEERIEDYQGLGLKGWIQLLPQNQLMKDGLKVLADFPEVVTNIRGMTWDVDATAAYPTCTMVGNVSKETCVNELIQVDGIHPEIFKEQNLGVCLGGVNTLDYMSSIFSLVPLDKIDALLED